MPNIPLLMIKEYFSAKTILQNLQLRIMPIQLYKITMQDPGKHQVQLTNYFIG
jgi:hypothetical protein